VKIKRGKTRARVVNSRLPYSLASTNTILLDLRSRRHSTIFLKYDMTVSSIGVPRTLAKVRRNQ